ncbi:extracellular matrix protein 1-like isoform X2 [Lampris incognitus]|uniref:extracellular matrix protein 1-like isoform X2 n=1 Tax=Lampris incognitus TaxID=2546036 RepID=UPI0024B5BB35|nr:extracellular matrix protein 1-like isoform X2 [Lampris incognitus]
MVWWRFPARLCAIVLLFTAAASEDGPFAEQREVSLDMFDDIIREMNPSDPDMMQREVDLADYFQTLVDNSRADDQTISQVDVTRDVGGYSPRQGQPMFGPRSFRYPPSLDYPVEFPPGRPTPANLKAICLHGDRRPRYPDTYFPVSGFGQQRRRAAAVNNAESWFSMCCKGKQTWGEEVTLCCAKQAWRLAVDSFCEEDMSVKDRQYDCCAKRGNARLDCFQSDAQNPAYQPTMEVPVTPVPAAFHFTFEPNACATEMSPRSIRGKKQKKPVSTSPQNVDISFPPGRPTEAGTESLCRHRKLRPRYDLKCLPRKGYGWLARQSKTINRVEKGFKQCCKRKQDVFTCVDGKWREEMDRFCQEEKGGKTSFGCCEKAEGRERYDCFQAHAPQPGYEPDLSAPPAATSQGPPSLGQICETHKIIKKKFSVGFPLQSLVSQCCPLSSDQKTPCIQEKLEKMSKSMCSARKPSSPAARQCCHTPTQPSSQCLSNILMDAITKATSARRIKKRKCPLS